MQKVITTTRRVFLGGWPLILGILALNPNHYPFSARCFHLWCDHDKSPWGEPIDFLVLTTNISIIIYIIVHLYTEHKREKENRIDRQNFIIEQTKNAEATKKILEEQEKNSDATKLLLVEQAKNAETATKLIEAQNYASTLTESIFKMQQDFERQLRLAPNYEVFREARGHFIECLEYIDQYLYPLKQPYSLDTDKIIELHKHISTLFITICRLAERYFEREHRTLGFNIMFYIDINDGLIKNIDDLLHHKQLLFVRRHHKKHLKGILYLPPSLNFPANNIKSQKYLSLPVYELSAGVYTSMKQKYDRTITLPGAPAAFHNTISVITNTLDKECYQSLDDESRNDMLKYFGKRSEFTKSLLSLKLPNEMGVLNIESPHNNAFIDDEKHMQTFYTMIYPTLISLTEFLELYKIYLISALR